MDNDYSKREIDHLIADIKSDLQLILAQTTKHNGRLTRVETVILVMGTAIAVLLVTNSSELLQIFKVII